MRDGSDIDFKEREVLVSESGYDREGGSIYYTGEVDDPRGSRNLPRLVKGELDDIRLAEKNYRAINALPSDPDRRGLESFVRLESVNKAPIYVLDEHHHAFFAWNEGYKEGEIKGGATLVHIDSHNDAWTVAKGEVLPAVGKLDSDFAYLKSKLHEGKFVDPAIKMGLVDSVLFLDPLVNSEKRRYNIMDIYRFDEMGVDNNAVNQLLATPVDNLIVDIDIDFFDPHLRQPGWILNSRGRFDNVNAIIRHDLEIISKLIDIASLVTVATSPGWMRDQERGVELIKELVSGRWRGR